MEEIEEIIENAIQQLPQKHQEVFRMSRFENMTYKEIAKQQNISIKTVIVYAQVSVYLVQTLKRLLSYYDSFTLF